jgi:thymidylate kinase
MTPSSLSSASTDKGPSPILISFSGIDGAGKSTQIEALEVRLRTAGLSLVRLQYWDDAAVLKRFREDTMAMVFNGEKGIGSAEKPVRRNDKNVRRWYLTLGRCALFLLDAMSLRAIVARAKRQHRDVIIFDRYTFDPLAALPLDNRPIRAYAHFLLKVAPRPHVAYVLDEIPEAAHRRKPEYPVDFLHRYRQAYLLLSALAGMSVIEPGAPDEVHQKVWAHLEKYVPGTCSNLASGRLNAKAENPLVDPKVSA